MSDLPTLHMLKQSAERLGLFCEKMAEEIGKIPPTESAEEFRNRICNMLKKLAAQYQAMADQDEEEIKRLNG
jgi:hypothetical protein